MARVLRVDMSGVPRKVARLKDDPRAGRMASAEAARLMSPYVPRLTGALEDSSDVQEPWVVYYRMPYARRQYYGDGFNFTRDYHPAARSRWDKGIDKAALARKLTVQFRSL